MSKIEIYRNRLQIAKSTEESLITEIKSSKDSYTKELAEFKALHKEKIKRLNTRLNDNGKKITVIEAFLKKSLDPQIEVDKEIAAELKK